MEGENNSDYDERRPHERELTIPDFNYCYNLQFMPDTIQDNSGIDEICEHAPEILREQVGLVLDGFFRKGRYFFESLITKPPQSTQVEPGLIAHQDGSFTFHVYIPNMKPIEVYEVPTRLMGRREG